MVSRSEFRGYENWQVINVARTEGLLKVIVGNPVAMDAYRAGIPGNGKPFPDGSKMAKVEWHPKKSATAPYDIAVADTIYDLDFMVKDAKRFADSDLSALRTVARWIETFVAKPHKDLGRAGPVCPFVPQARERKSLWFAPERIASKTVADVVELTVEASQHHSIFRMRGSLDERNEGAAIRNPNFHPFKAPCRSC